VLQQKSKRKKRGHRGDLCWEETKLVSNLFALVCELSGTSFFSFKQSATSEGFFSVKSEMLQH
jgi:hypothetical protein